MRYDGEVRFRLTGPREECIKYIPDARKLLGIVWNIHRELGGLEIAERSTVLANGVRLRCFITNSVPILEIDVTPAPEKEKPSQYYLVRAIWEPEGMVLTPATGRRDEVEWDRQTYKAWGLPSRNADDVGEMIGLVLDDTNRPTDVGIEGLTEGEPEINQPKRPGGSIPQVILNQYPNNKYLDKAETLSYRETDAEGEPLGDVGGLLLAVDDMSNSLLAGSYELVTNSNIKYEHWHTHSNPLSYTMPDSEAIPPVTRESAGYFDGAAYWLESPDTQVAGIFDVATVVSDVGTNTSLNLLLAQYAADGEANFFEEPDEEDWFTHRPQEILYPNSVYEDIFQHTNVVREAYGEEPVYRMIRGDGNAAYMVSYQLNASDPPGLFFHSHPDYQPGYRTTGGRCENATGREAYSAYTHNARENTLALSNSEDFGEDTTGVGIAKLWQNSPTHLANMVATAWSQFPIPVMGYQYGTKLASHQIGSLGTSDYTIRQQYDADSEVLTPQAIDPPLEGGTAVAQIFTNKETWVPTYDWTSTTTMGTAGTFNGSNPYSHVHWFSNRSVGTGRTIYEFPASIAPSYQVLLDPPATVGLDFLGCVGAALFELAGVTWMRCAYWTASIVEDLTDQPLYPYPFDGDECTLHVVRFPTRLHEASVIPWSPDDEEGEWVEEFSETWLFADGWLTLPPAKVVFNSTGDRFTWTMHKIGASYTDALTYMSPLSDTSALTNPRHAIDCHHHEYRAPDLTDPEVQDTQGTLVVYVPDFIYADVKAYKNDVDLAGDYSAWVEEGVTQEDIAEDTSHYERDCFGTTEVFPHYSKDDALVYVTLEIDEYSLQRGNSGIDGGEDPENPPARLPWADQTAFMWRHRKLIWPSGKEVVYMQQYMGEDLTVDFTTDPPANIDRIADLSETSGSPRPYPGVVDPVTDKLSSFYLAISYMDEVNEDMIYAKIFTQQVMMNYIPSTGEILDDDDENPLGEWYHFSRGSVEWWLDLNPKKVDPNIMIGEPPVEPEPILELLGTQYDNADELPGWLPEKYIINHKTPLYPYRATLPSSNWVYNQDQSPGAYFYTKETFNGSGAYFADVAACHVPTFQLNVIFQYQNTDGDIVRPAIRGNPAARVDAPWGRPASALHQVGCYTGYGYTGGDATGWWLGSPKKAMSFMVGNISPTFSTQLECEAKVVRYGDRIVARVKNLHMPKTSYVPGPNIQGSNLPNSSYPWTEWKPIAQDYPPPELDTVEGSESRDLQVLLWANFDLDEATGIVGVSDIWPMGTIV
jgi:hypothetical protein